MEFFTRNYIDTFGIDAVVLRFSAVIREWAGADAGAIGTLLAAFVEPARRGETAVIDNPAWTWRGLAEFIDARDSAEAAIAALYAGRLPQHVYNINGAAAYEVSDFARIVGETFPPAKVDIRAEAAAGLCGAPVYRMRMDGAAAARDFGYRARYDLAASLRHYAG